MKKLWEDCDEDGRKMLKKMGITLVLLILANFLTGVVAVMLYGIAYLIIGLDVLKEAVEGLKGGKVFNENTLMAIATIGAFAIKQYPEAVFVMFFYKIGELFEDIAVKNSRSSITALPERSRPAEPQAQGASGRKPHRLQPPTTCRVWL